MHHFLGRVYCSGNDHLGKVSYFLENQSINLFNLTLVIMVTILPADILIYTTLFEASLSPVENLRWLDWNVPGYPLFHFGLEN